MRADRFWDKARERAFGAAPALFCFCTVQRGPGLRRRAARQRGKENGNRKERRKRNGIGELCRRGGDSKKCFPGKYKYMRNLIYSDFFWEV